MSQLILLHPCAIVTLMTNTTISSENLGVFTEIVSQHLPSVETLETRNRDSLDFHEVSVATLVSMLNEAFVAGQNTTR